MIRYEEEGLRREIFIMKKPSQWDCTRWVVHQITEWLRYRSATEPPGTSVLTTIGNLVTSVGPLKPIQLFTPQCGSVASMNNHLGLGPEAMRAVQHSSRTILSHRRRMK